MLPIEEQRKVLLAIQAGFANGSVTLGSAVKRLRNDVTEMTQDEFADLCDISVRTLRQVEQDEGNPTIKTISSIFSMFGMHLTVEVVST
jgi:DNA-binding XRE family transcriptional regulator